MLQIEEVVAQAAKHLLDGIRVAVIQGGIGRDARTYLVQITVARVTFHDLVDVELALRTGTDERHLADKYIPKLGQLVQMVLAQEFPDLCQTGIGTALIQRRTELLRIQTHTTELVDVERTAEATDTFLLENGRTAVLMLHGKVTNQKQGRENDQHHNASRCAQNRSSRRG